MACVSTLPLLVWPNVIRHTAASLAVSAGTNVKAEQTMLGHASAALTLDVLNDARERAMSVSSANF